MRRNPAPDSSMWTEIVSTQKLDRGDYVRGGPRSIVWTLEWYEELREMGMDSYFVMRQMIERIKELDAT